MFKDYKITSYLGYNLWIANQFQHRIKIIDDDFEEEIVINTSNDREIIIAICALLEVYSKRHINVVPNLVCLILNYKDIAFWLELMDIVKFIECHVSEFKPYSQQVKQLLLFS